MGNRYGMDIQNMGTVYHREDKLIHIQLGYNLDIYNNVHDVFLKYCYLRHVYVAVLYLQCTHHVLNIESYIQVFHARVHARIEFWRVNN